MSPRTLCTKCGANNLRFVCESFDAIDRVYVGTVVCCLCGASLLYSRKGTEPLPDYTAEPRQHWLPLERGA